jgi:hypothetical protein
LGLQLLAQGALATNLLLLADVLDRAVFLLEIGLQGRKPYVLVLQAAPGRSDQADHGRRDLVGGERWLEGGLDHRSTGHAATGQLPEYQGAHLVQLALLRPRRLKYYWPFEIESSSAAQTAFATRIASSYYVPGGTFGSLPLRSKIQAPS